MITILPSPTADSRTCDAKTISKTVLYESTRLHQLDVASSMNFFCDLIEKAGVRHDDHKIKTMDAFHKAFAGGFVDKTWWNEHKKERHHLPENLEDVNLIDIFENISDCVTAGMARTGQVLPLGISNEVLQKAFQNTVKLLINNIRIKK